MALTVIKMIVPFGITLVTLLILMKLFKCKKGFTRNIVGNCVPRCKMSSKEWNDEKKICERKKCDESLGSGVSHETHRMRIGGKCVLRCKLKNNEWDFVLKKCKRKKCPQGDQYKRRIGGKCVRRCIMRNRVWNGKRCVRK